MNNCCNNTGAIAAALPLWRLRQGDGWEPPRSRSCRSRWMLQGLPHVASRPACLRHAGHGTCELLASLLQASERRSLGLLYVTVIC